MKDNYKKNLVSLVFFFIDLKKKKETDGQGKDAAKHNGELAIAL